ncbi:MAG TPA: protein kinase [Gemmatimonadales bacterium]|nr:protein kinase [Gemmatimonadales bacterium]
MQAIASGQVADFDLVKEALSAEYELLEELGRGGMALVYRARDRELEREVAIKVLPFSLAFDAEFVERFQREARTAGGLEHPNIIPIYRVGRSGRVIYFVMKYLRGGSLSTALAERGRLTPPEIRRILVEAGSALGYAAQRGVVHRDIKPDNIMFDEFGHTVLTDFGIAKAASGQKLTGTGMSIGTPHYMSPEQARAQPIDGRSDIYSLGVVAYQALAGNVPYDGEDSFSIGYKHITEPVPVPALASADERRLYEVIRRMLMKDPADRFQSCEELVAALQGQPVAAPAPAIRPTARTAAASLAVPGAAPAPAAVLSPLPNGAGAENGVAAAAGGRTMPVDPLAGALPPLASQPTTPITSPIVDRRARPAERRARNRRVADRNPALRGGRHGVPAWLWLLLAVGGGGAGMVYYYHVRGFAPGRAAQQAEAAQGVANRTTSTAGQVQLPPDSAAPGSVAAAPAAPDSAVLGAVPAAAPAAPADGAAAPCEPGPAYNAFACVDALPRPLVAPLVPVPADAATRQPAPSVLWVRVSADGRTLELRPKEPSADAAFEREVERFARTLRWAPARKDSTAVTAWVQALFRPAS